jgi:hypothetical protein
VKLKLSFLQKSIMSWEDVLLCASGTHKLAKEDPGCPPSPLDPE